MNPSTDISTPPGSPNKPPPLSPPNLTHIVSAPDRQQHVALPKNKSTSNLLAHSQRSPAALSVNTKRLSIDAGQLDRMAR